MTPIQVMLRRIGPCAFEATDRDGNTARLDGSPELEAQIRERAPDPEALTALGEGSPASSGPRVGLRPMHLLLASVAGCSAMDIVLILARQRQDLRDLVIEVEGSRVDATPAPFERIALRFTAYGDVSPDRLHHAVELGVTKYCSVAATLDPKVSIEWEATVAPMD
ncbi:MAG: hypothetical protein OHK0029_26900 [Armatimonadaceae bacterium]